MFRTIGNQRNTDFIKWETCFSQMYMHSRRNGSNLAGLIRKNRILPAQWARDMGCNFVAWHIIRTTNKMVRQAERMGLMVGPEIPVYWTIQWNNEEPANAEISSPIILPAIKTGRILSFGPLLTKRHMVLPGLSFLNPVWLKNTTARSDKIGGCSHGKRRRTESRTYDR